VDQDQDPVDRETKRRNLTETLRKYRSLAESQGWEELRRIIEAQATARENSVLRIPAKSLGGLFQKEFASGEATGLRSVIALVDTVVRDTQDQLDEMKLEDGNATPESDSE
jgi:hypothetical protein